VSLPSQCLFPLWGFGLTAQQKRLSACETPVCYCIYQPISCKCHVSTKLDNSHMQSNTTALQYIVHFKGCCTKQWIIDHYNTTLFLSSYSFCWVRAHSHILVSTLLLLDQRCDNQSEPPFKHPKIYFPGRLVQWDLSTIGGHPLVPLLKSGNHLCLPQYRRSGPLPPRYPEEVCQTRRLSKFQSFQYFRANPPHPPTHHGAHQRPLPGI